MRAWLCVVACIAGCDSRAGASDPAAGRTEQKSREYESCGASMHCQDNLRCFDHVCRRTARSTVGDYHAASGAAARARGDLEAAIVAYATALAQYDAEKLGVPPDVDCAYGATLAMARARKEHGELGARVLHRCLLALPPGGALREQALAHLATLAEVGLDPLLLGAAKTGDLYLTKAPQRPASDKVAITVSATPVPTAKSYGVLSARLGEPEARPALVACWDAYTAATRKTVLAVTLPMKVAGVPGEYEDDPVTYTLKLDAGPAGATPEAAAEACVRKAVEAAVQGLKLPDAMTAKVAITIK